MGGTAQTLQAALAVQAKRIRGWLGPRILLCVPLGPCMGVAG